MTPTNVQDATTYKCDTCSQTNEVTTVAIQELHKGNRFFSSCKGCSSRTELTL